MATVLVPVTLPVCLCCRDWSHVCDPSRQHKPTGSVTGVTCKLVSSMCVYIEWCSEVLWEAGCLWVCLFACVRLSCHGTCEGIGLLGLHKSGSDSCVPFHKQVG